MAGPAERLEPVRVIGVLRRIVLQADDVVSLETPRPTALAASPAVALEDGAAHGGPASRVKVGVVAAQNGISSSKSS